jgi:magnesium-transporting ATPase (P-type)
MFTSDDKITAIATAKECGIINDQGEENEECLCMEGPEFTKFVGELDDTLTLLSMKKVRNKLKVLAGSSPNDKYIMVAGLRQLGDIVAVTDDGTNDVQALKKADVSFAMRSGTQDAHSAADIIIQDDNFASIV